MTLSAQVIDDNPIGYFRVFAQPPGGLRREITVFRDAPINMSSCSTTDPFTDSTAQMSLGQVTVFDTPGQGDLDWLVPDCDIDIVWENTSWYDFTWTWEGYIASYDFSLDGSSSQISIDLKGALYALDDFVAKPEYPRRPIPYEVLLERAFDPIKHPARLSKLRVRFPKDWNRRVPSFNEPSYFWFLKPWGVNTGQLWTGLTSRSTGAWDPVLTGYVQSLLSVMFDEGNAQWTIRNRGKRRPELFLRRPPTTDDPKIIEIVLGAPGVDFNATRDFTQRANVIYGQGTDQAGVQYNGMVIGPNGNTTRFKPYAYANQVYPRERNPRLDLEARPKEVMLKFQDGLDEPAAQRVAQSHLQRFIDPGITGTITLTTDPLLANGSPFPRMLIKAGSTLRIKGLFGIPEGYMVHVTQTDADFNNLTMSLTFDSKYRDVLTVEEVQARTRDALDPVRALQVGKYANLVDDLIMPWSYSEGSGILPSGGELSAVPFFNRHLPPTAEFPYEEYTKKYPPKKYPQYYVRIGPTNKNDATKNWARRPGEALPMPIPIRMSQAGTIRLSQIAAYDKNGNVMPVRFHVSIYLMNGSGPGAMPKFPSDPDTIKFLKPKGVSGIQYKVRQSNPFFKDAWEQTLEDGREWQHQGFLLAKDAVLIIGWGNYYEPAGYSPGRASRGADRTGQLVDTTPWSWDISQDPRFNRQNPNRNRKNEDLGMLFVNIYCDEQGDQPVYFMGRFFRTEPGQG